jgi:hypothetical protein
MKTLINLISVLIIELLVFPACCPSSDCDPPNTNNIALNTILDMNNFISGGFVETPVSVTWSSNNRNSAVRVLQVYFDSQLIYPDNPHAAQCPGVTIPLDTGYYEFKIWVPDAYSPEKTSWVHVVNKFKSLSGPNLSNWECVVGDGTYTAPDEAPVNMDDIDTINRTNYSILEANIKNRRIQAHNITFNRIFDDLALTYIHEAGYSFKLPYIPSTSNTDLNGQTIEGGLFVWDGAITKLDYGLAFQWTINPWDPAFKDIRIWNGTSWENIGILEPDTIYHSVRFNLDILKKTAGLTLDGNKFQENVFSETPKTGWGSEITARLQAEIISIYPPESGFTPSHKGYFKDWDWLWKK